MSDRKNQQLREALQKKYPGSVLTEKEFVLNVIPTGSLSLDYALGVGGWARGTYSSIYGLRNVGKTVLGLTACKNAMAMGLNVGFISVEGWHKEDWIWARELGIDTSSDKWLVVEPNTAEDAFEMMGEMIEADIKLIIVDSLGAMVSATEAKGGEKRVAGQSGPISYGLKRWNNPVKKNNVCVLLLNQVRDVIGSSSPYNPVRQPGGYTVEFLSRVIVELIASNSAANVVKHPQDNDILIGRKIIARVKRTKLTKGDNQRAEYFFYSDKVEGYPFGIDVASDVVNTGKRTGVINATGAWLNLPDGSRHQGQATAGRYILENSAAYEEIRSGILNVMLKRNNGEVELVEDGL